MGSRAANNAGASPNRGYHRGSMKLARYLLFFLAFSAFAANIKLYLKDGDHHLVREYKVEGDRVRYYSVERGDWEEIPLELVDLKRTEAETNARQAAIEEEAKMITAEDKAERERRNEVAKIPQTPGVPKWRMTVRNFTLSCPRRSALASSS
jgi:hypothetical protein